MFKKRTPNLDQRKAFGKVIRNARICQGYTQEALAESMSCSVRWISQIEEGKSSPNNMDTVLLMLSLKLLPEEVAGEVGWHVSVPAHRK